MSFKKIVLRELKEMRDGIGSMSRKGVEGKHWRSSKKSYIAPDVVAQFEPIGQGEWANLPPELLLDIIRRVEESETAWPARIVVVFCASVCRSWRDVTKEIVETPEQCGKLTFPISLKQPGPRDTPIQCFIKRDRATSTYRLYFGLTPSEDENDKLLLAAKKMRRATSTDFIISLVTVSRMTSREPATHTLENLGKSNFLGTKFAIYDSQPPTDASVQHISRQCRRFNPTKVSPKLPAYNFRTATISYELNVLRTRGPRRMHCVMHSIPASSVQQGGTAPTPSSFSISCQDDIFSSTAMPKGNEPVISFSSPNLSIVLEPSRDSLVLKNKAPRWHEQLQCWCLNFRGRVTVASVKNFQLVASVDPSLNVTAAEQEKVILQFGKIGKDIFTMDYHYPLSAFQAFAICLSSFDTKPACE